MPNDPWDPAAYAGFRAERAEPFLELLRLLEPGAPGRAVDLGCGSGELTALAHERLGCASLLGLDASPAMIERARTLERPGLSFARADLATWTSAGDHDLVLSNAALHWVPDHAAVLRRWTLALAPGGQLAVQVPANADHPAHQLAAEVALEEPFCSALGGAPPPDPVAENVLAPQAYAELLHELGYARQHVRLQVFAHTLPATEAVGDWLAGSTLNRFKQLLPAALFAAYRERLRHRSIEVLGDRRPWLFTFKRVLLWARRPGKFADACVTRS